MEEDAILGLGPNSLPVPPEEEVEMTLPSMHGVGADGDSGWSFEKALQAKNNKNNGSAEEDENGSDEEEESTAGGSNDQESSNNGNTNHADADLVHRDGGNAATFGAAAASSDHAGEDSSKASAMDDDALLRISDKKEAKGLGKKMYKRWKKLNKKLRKHKNSSKKEKKSSSKEKAKKSSSSGNGSKSKGKNKRSRKTRDRDDDYDDVDDSGFPINTRNAEENVEELGLVPATELSDAAAAIEARLQKANVREAKMRFQKAMRKSTQPKSTSAEVIAVAKELVASMAKARQLDDDIVSGRSTRLGAFPLNRVALKDLVLARCRQKFMAGPLVEAGILQELSYWLYDVDRAEPAPYELRTTALDILLTLPLEGSIPMSDDLTQFMGVSREHLIKTDVGRALNALRKYSDETVDNRGKCVQLLTAFSRVISGTAEREQNDENKSKAVWKCQRDPTVASPFEVLETSSEALQKSFLKPDPRDPTSYNGLLPWRPPAATITNVSGTLSAYIEKAIPRKR